VPEGIPNRARGGHWHVVSALQQASWGANMITTFADPFNDLINLQRALEAS
jgi:hypothetical protein